MGIHRVPKRLANGETRIYHYAWRGGPRITAKPDSRAFLAEYVRLTHGRKDAIQTGTLAELVVSFQNSVEYAKLKPRTKKDYEDHFPHILEQFADLPIPALEERGIRAVIKDWHEGMAAAPRRADMRLSALSRVLSFAVDREIIDINKALGISKLSHGTRRDIIWTGEQLDKYVHSAPEPLAQAVMLGLWTGQRQGDLLTLPWSSYDGRVISLKQNKGGKRVRVRVSDELKSMLDAMPKKAITILTNEAGRSWGSGFGGHFRRWQGKLDIKGVTYHDLRGTFITVAYANGYSISEIARATGHTEKHCERIINDHYLAADLTINVNEYRTKM